ncbi:MAG: glutamate-5-semialdehyde dehydrogenase [Phycisphaerales bacterium]|nr:glutamate-5-semialdehyde dehydrogenase [Phycisphaerales bacterium]
MSGAGDALLAQCRAAAEAASGARLALGGLTPGARRDLLLECAAGLRSSAGAIVEANAQDLAGSSGLDAAMRDRLRLDAGRVAAMAAAVESIARQDDPVGKVVEGRVLPNGLRLQKRRVPLGVVLVIYESRPNVTSDAAALCLKSGNAVLLKGGREAAHSNRAIVAAMRPALAARGVADAVVFVDTTDRRATELLVGMDDLIDLAIPRGGPGLIRAVVAAARVPVVKHDAGNCHVYVDGHLDGLEDAAERIVVNAKAQRPGVCNAAETLLVHRAAAGRMLPRLASALSARGVELRGCEESRALVPSMKAATEEDWGTEYLALIMAVRVVGGVDEACAHIRRWGSRHTEAIVTSSLASAERFVSLLDSASVMVNCSTRFADGGEYGLGAEIGISTNKLHARGPMGAEDLTTFQWVVRGEGQIRG